MIQKNVALVVGLIAVLLALACGGGKSSGNPQLTTPVPVTGVTLDQSTLGLVNGANRTLNATVAPANATDKVVAWSTSNAAVATVNSSGVVTAVAPGTATITVTTHDGAKTATCAVTVTATGAAVTGVTLNKTSTTLSPNGTESLVATVQPANATDKAVTWSTSNAAVATVNGGGVITAVAAGTATITVTTHDGGKTATCAVTVTPAGIFITPGTATGDVTVAIDSHTTSPVSPYVFGINFKYDISPATGGDNWPSGLLSPRIKLNRVGGNTTSTIDWRTGYVNKAADYNYYNFDDYVSDPTIPGSSLTLFGAPSFADDTALLWTVPLLPYVAGDGNNPDNGKGIALDWHNPNQVAATDRYQLNFVPADPNRVRKWVAKNPAGATATPRMTGDGYADDLIKWIQTHYADNITSRTKRLMVCLDNEPDGWSWDYSALHGWALGWPKGSASWTVIPGHAFHVQRTVDMATAIKDVEPNIDVFGGVFMGFDGLYNFGDGDNSHPGHGVPSKWMNPATGYPATKDITFPYLEMWLDALNTASGTRGARLVDVLDTHYYFLPLTHDGRDTTDTNVSAATDAQMLNARMQGPRALWEPAYHGNSEVEWKDGRWGLLRTGETNAAQGGEPLNWLNRLKGTLTKYPNGPQKLAITEYFLGRGGDISGAVAQADMLGVLAREGVYAATIWPLEDTHGAGYGGSMGKAYKGVAASLAAWVDYDGHGAGSGDTYAVTTITDANRPPDPNRPTVAPTQTLERVTAYATYDAANPSRMVVVAINKNITGDLNVGFAVTHTSAFTKIERYQITGANGTAAAINGPVKLTDLATSGTNVFNATLPAQSITVLVLRP